MSVIWLGVYLALAAGDWLAAWKRWTAVLFFFKPAALAALLVWTAYNLGWSGQSAWFTAGLVCSLAGDIALMFPKRLFFAGAGAFAAAHICYLLGYGTAQPPVDLAGLVVVLPVAGAAGFVFNRLRRKLTEHPMAERLRPMVLLYGALLSLMTASSLLTLFRADWPAPAAYFSAAGGCLFFLSDSLLAYSRFARPFSRDRVWVHATYHLAQLGLCLGAVGAAGKLIV